MQKMWVRSLGQEDPLEEGMATHSSILAWRIPQRSLVGYRPQGCKEPDMTKVTYHIVTERHHHLWSRERGLHGRLTDDPLGEGGVPVTDDLTGADLKIPD